MTATTSYICRASAWCQTAEVDRPSDRIVLTALTHIALFEDGNFPCHKSLATRLQLSESTVRQATYRLQRRGLILCTRRYNGNGAQSTNHYELVVTVDGRRIAPAPATPRSQAKVDTDTSRPEPRRRAAGPTSKPAMVSELPPPGADPVLPEIGPTEVQVDTGGAPGLPRKRLATSLAKPTGQEIAAARDRVPGSPNRAQKPVDDWTARDFALGWQQRLRDSGKNTDLGGLMALASRFRDLQKAGVSNQHLDAMSAAYFADPRRRSRPTRGDEFRRFISESTALLEQVRPTQTTGFYAKVRQAANFGTLRNSEPQ